MSAQTETSSRYIPEPIKRAVRAKCGFGCIFCGIPMFDYEHLDDFADVQGHDVNNINLICPNHHRMKTSGKLSYEVVKQQSLNPFNLSKSRTSGLKLEISGNNSTFTVGSNVYSWSSDENDNDFTAIMIKDKPVLKSTVEDGWLLFDLVLANPWGIPQLVVEKGEIFISTAVWDFTNEGHKFTIRNGPKNISSEMNIAGDEIEITKGLFCVDNRRLRVYPDKCIIDPDIFYIPLKNPIIGSNHILKETSAHNCMIGVSIE